MDSLQTSLGAPGASSGASSAGAGTPGGGASQAGAPGRAPVQSTVKSTPEQRAKWREKRERAKARKAGGAVSSTDTTTGPSATGPESLESDNASLPGSQPPVLWSPATLRPLFDQLVPVAETLAKNQLSEVAKEISPAALALVASKGGWNPLATTALKEGGAATAAKYLNAAGISAEYAPEVQLGVALGSILAGHMMLLQELREMAAEKKQTIDIKAKVEVQPDKPNEAKDKDNPASGALAA